jgi:hypothetical protein
VIDFAEWRADVVAALKAGDVLHLSLLLDRMEDEWRAITSEPYLDISPVSVPDHTPPHLREDWKP